jgi:hypothetical protein
LLILIRQLVLLLGSFSEAAEEEHVDEADEDDEAASDHVPDVASVEAQDADSG